MTYRIGDQVRFVLGDLGERVGIIETIRAFPEYARYSVRDLGNLRYAWDVAETEERSIVGHYIVSFDNEKDRLEAYCEMLQKEKGK